MCDVKGRPLSNIALHISCTSPLQAGCVALAASSAAAGGSKPNLYSFIATMPSPPAAAPARLPVEPAAMHRQLQAVPLLPSKQRLRGPTNLESLSLLLAPRQLLRPPPAWPARGRRTWLAAPSAPPCSSGCTAEAWDISCSAGIFAAVPAANLGKLPSCVFADVSAQHASVCTCLGTSAANRACSSTSCGSNSLIRCMWSAISSRLLRLHCSMRQ